MTTSTIARQTGTPDPLQVSALVAQLRALAHLTRVEARVARVRTTQARTAAVRRELETNARDADRRVERLDDALRSLDAVPDVLAPVVGQVLAFVKATVEQAQPIDEAVLGDLVLEHQLLDRARYANAIAERIGIRTVADLTDALVEAHTETVEWLHTVLAQEASGGPRVLEPTTLQSLVGGATRLAGWPARFAVEQANRVADTIVHRGKVAKAQVEGTVEGTVEGAKDIASDVADTARRIGRDTAEVAAAGRDAALTKAEQVAEREDADTVADVAHSARAEVGALAADELPVPDYDELAAGPSITAIRQLDDADDVRTIAAFEKRNKNRVSVLDAAESRLSALED